MSPTVEELEIAFQVLKVLVALYISSGFLSLSLFSRDYIEKKIVERGKNEIQTES